MADTFAHIKDSPLERLVLFYFSSSPTSSSALSTLNTAARRLRQRLPHFSFQHCDGELQANRADFSAAGFNQPGQWLFTSTPVEGISQTTPAYSTQHTAASQASAHPCPAMPSPPCHSALAVKYTGPVTVADIVDHVRSVLLSHTQPIFPPPISATHPPSHSPSPLPLLHSHKYLPSNSSDLLTFTTEDSFYDLLDSSPSPIFLKYYEPWCAPLPAPRSHLRRRRPASSHPASRCASWRCSARRMRTRGGGGDRQGVNSYPVLMLHGGKEVGRGGGGGGKGSGVRFEEEMRSVAAFDRWFEKEVDGYRSVVKEERKKRKEGKTRRPGEREEGEGEGVDEEAVEKREQEGKGKKMEVKDAKGEDRRQAKLVQKRMVDAAVAAAASSAVVLPAVKLSVEERLTALEGEVKEVLGAVQRVEAAVERLLARKSH